MAQSRIFSDFAPSYKVISWRNLHIFLIFAEDRLRLGIKVNFIALALHYLRRRNIHIIIMETSIIGRQKEIERLKKYLASDKSEFIAVYGRRRVGKTFLIKELLEGQFTFRMTGRENARMSEQLMNFSYARYFFRRSISF